MHAGIERDHARGLELGGKRNGEAESLPKTAGSPVRKPEDGRGDGGGGRFPVSLPRRWILVSAPAEAEAEREGETGSPLVKNGEKKSQARPRERARDYSWGYY